MGPAQLCPKGLSDLAMPHKGGRSAGSLDVLSYLFSSAWLSLTLESYPRVLCYLLFHGPSLNVLLRPGSSLQPSCTTYPVFLPVEEEGGHLNLQVSIDLRGP